MCPQRSGGHQLVRPQARSRRSSTLAVPASNITSGCDMAHFGKRPGGAGFLDARMMRRLALQISGIDTATDLSEQRTKRTSPQHDGHSGPAASSETGPVVRASATSGSLGTVGGSPGL
jgi:hypothetical protein